MIKTYLVKCENGKCPFYFLSFEKGLLTTIETLQ